MVDSIPACLECGKPLLGSPSVVRRRKYCDWACRTARPRDSRQVERGTWSCGVCGKRCSSHPSEASARKYCSPTCAHTGRGETRRDRVTVHCGWCGLSFEKRPSEIAEGRGKFCSKTCAGHGRPINCRPSKVGNEAIALVIQRHEALAIPEHRVGRWSIDLAFPVAMVAVEIDGTYWHSLPAMRERDARKNAALSELGWTVVRVPAGARATGESVAALIEEQLLRLLPRPRSRRSQLANPER